ncbi:MAG: hypothetical protein IKP91_02940 [Bacteroidaceae bacterium]|nr:hypothetical protein [Bacteroidaceae bacterium]
MEELQGDKGNRIVSDSRYLLDTFLTNEGPSALIEGPSNLAEGGNKKAKEASGKRGFVKVGAFHAFTQKHPMKSLKIVR